MSLIKFKPITPSRRYFFNIKKKNLWKGNSLKKLTTKNKNLGGRNNFGRLTVRGRCKSKNKLYRVVDFKRRSNLLGVIQRLEFDPNRSSFIALVRYNRYYFSYILAPNGVKKGSIVQSGECVSIKNGNCTMLKKIPVGISIHNIELKPNKGGQISRSAGSNSIIMGKENNKVIIKISSGEIILIENKCFATIGILSNLNNKNIVYGKAGRKNWLGFKSKVRGVAKNPVDHPHGGGEGKSSGGRHPVNFKGLSTKGFKTRKKKINKLIFKYKKKK